MKCKVGVTEGNDLLAYSFPSPHPFNSARVLAFWDELKARDVAHTRIEPQYATEAQISLFHTASHISQVRNASTQGTGWLDDGDTPAFPGVYEAASCAVGSTLAAIERVLSGDVDHAVNPVGGLHHARRDVSAGFCVFNDIGVAIELLRSQHGLRRILYVDIDVHHGDGVYYPYESDPEVAIFDIHEDGTFLYPGTGSSDEAGTGPATGTKVNVPLSPWSGDEESLAQLPRIRDLARIARPDFIIFQCGADGLKGDPIAGLEYSERTHREVGGLLHNLSHELCSGRIVALGGGGYLPSNCASAWTAVVESFQGPPKTVGR